MPVRGGKKSQINQETVSFSLAQCISFQLGQNLKPVWTREAWPRTMSPITDSVGFSKRCQILRLSLIDRLDVPISRRSALKAAFRDFMEVTSVIVQRGLWLSRFLKHHRKLKNSEFKLKFNFDWIKNIYSKLFLVSVFSMIFLILLTVCDIK